MLSLVACGKDNDYEDKTTVDIDEACTSSYVAIAPTTSKEYAENVAKYLRTRLFNLLIGEIKVIQSASKEVYQLVPMQDFTSNSDIDWS